MADSELYSRLLFPRRQGYPLFRPQPSDDLPEPVRKIGTEIGDVGVVTEFGCFDPIFNILRVADDPANRFGVPPGFEQASVDPKDIDARVLCHLPGTDISNTTVNKRRLDIDAGIDLNNVFFPLGAGAVVEVSTNSKQTALLLLPDGASRWDLRRKQAFRDYASKHAENWYAFVNGELGRMIGNGDLYLVTGVTKSTSWSVAALENNSGNGNVSLRLKAAQIGTGNASCVWQWESTSSSVDAGPRRRLGEESWRDNQTVFIRGFKVALRSKPKLLWRTPKVVSITNSKESEVFSKSTSVPNPQPRPQSGPSNNLPQNSPNNSDSSSASDSDTSNEYGPHLYHPADVINNYLLDCVPEAMVAVTHDDEWASVLDVAEDEVPEEYELIRRVSKQFDVEASSGGVGLRARSTGTGAYAPAGQKTSHSTIVSSSMSQPSKIPPTPVGLRDRSTGTGAYALAGQKTSHSTTSSMSQPRKIPPTPKLGSITLPDDNDATKIFGGSRKRLSAFFTKAPKKGISRSMTPAPVPVTRDEYPSQHRRRASSMANEPPKGSSITPTGKQAKSQVRQYSASRDSNSRAPTEIKLSYMSQTAPPSHWVPLKGAPPSTGVPGTIAFKEVALKDESIVLSWPLVPLADRRHLQHPLVYYDVAFDPREAANVRDNRNLKYFALPQGDRELPVSTHCKVTEMVIHCPHVGSLLVERPEGLRCIDVFYAIYCKYQKKPRSHEMPTADKAKYQRAFEQRCNDCPGLAEYNRTKIGFLRVDLLRGKRIFGGLKRSNGRWELLFDTPSPST